MTTLVVAADHLTAVRAARELGLVGWSTSSEYTGWSTVDTIVWVEGWGESTVPAAWFAFNLTSMLNETASAEHVYYRPTDADELTKARRAGERLDVLRGIRAYRRHLAALPPTLSPESMASAMATTPERAPWWRRLFRKATR